MNDAVFLDYTQAELDRAYDQFAWAPNAEVVLRSYSDLSDEVRARYHRETYAYGRAAEEKLDVFPARSGNAPIHVFVHGGAWRMLSKEESSFPAPTFVDAGVHFVAPDFGQLPQRSLPAIVRQLRRAISWLHGNAHRFGGDPARIYISGHSSGGHLAGVLAATDWTRHDLPRTAVKGAILASGMYDLRPVLLSARREYLRLSVSQEHALSPQRHVAALRCPVVVAHGGGESPEFVRQSRCFAAALAAERKAPHLLELHGLNHFEVALNIARSDGALAQVALTMIDRSER
jgi:arylformamidase